MSGVDRRSALSLCALPWLAVPAAADAGWRLLGERSVRLLGDRDEILVTARRGAMRRIRRRTRRGADSHARVQPWGWG
jgi:hypothetical protein